MLNQFAHPSSTARFNASTGADGVTGSEPVWRQWNPAAMWLTEFGNGQTVGRVAARPVSHAEVLFDPWNRPWCCVLRDQTGLAGPPSQDESGPTGVMFRKVLPGLPVRSFLKETWTCARTRTVVCRTCDLTFPSSALIGHRPSILVSAEGGSGLVCGRRRR